MTKAKAKVKVLTRDEIRAKILAPAKFKSELISLFGAEVEIRQPSLGDILDYQQEEDPGKAIMTLLIGYCYVPGTDELIFEEADKETILAKPFNEDLIALNEAVANLTGLDIEATEGNSKATV